MIRRRAGDEWWLISQDAHAKVAGTLASLLAGPVVPETLARAIDHHDAGWPLHDELPTLNEVGEPLDVFESPRTVVLPIWAESARRAQELGAHEGLLVSIHSLALSAMLAARASAEGDDTARLLTQFELNKFQHGEIERQEILRRHLGLRTDIPTTLGVAEDSREPAELQLALHYRVLRAMDLLSLCLCCTKPIAQPIDALWLAPGGPTVSVWVTVRGIGEYRVSPWIFEQSGINLQIPFRRVRAEPFASAEELRTMLAGKSPESLEVRLLPG